MNIEYFIKNWRNIKENIEFTEDEMNGLIFLDMDILKKNL